MNKKLGRTLNGDFWVLLIVLLIFSVLTAVVGEYVLALVEFVIAGVSFTVYMLYHSYRKRNCRLLSRSIRMHMQVPPVRQRLFPPH